jgi:tetratricopeptide (TPR) repeat protein
MKTRIFTMCLPSYLVSFLASATLIASAAAAPAQASSEKEATANSKPPGLCALQGDDAERAAGLDKAITAALKAGCWDEAIARAEELHALRSRVQGPKHFETTNDEWRLKTLRQVAPKSLEDHIAYLSANTMETQAEALHEKAKYAQAQPMFEKALETRRRLLTDEHPDTALSYNGVAMNLNALGKYAQAQPMFEKALGIRRRLLTDEHPDTALSYNNAAFNLDAWGKYAQAQPLHKKALEIRRRLLNDEHPDIAVSYHNLAHNLGVQGKLNEAQPLFEKALEIWRRLPTDNQHLVAIGYNSVAMNLYTQGMYAQAQPIFEKALEINRRLFTDNHPQTALNYNNVAANLDAQKKHAQAQPMFEKALEINRRLFTDNHPVTARGYNNMAANLRAQGKYAQAQPIFEKALEINRRLFTDNHPQTAFSYNHVALNLRAQGKYAQAQPMFEKALEINCRLLTDEHPHTAYCSADFAYNLNAQGKYREARDQLRSAARSLDKVRIRISFAGLERVGTVRSPRPALAAVQARLGRPVEAWQALEEDLGRGLLDELFGRQDQRLTAAERDRLRELITALERLDRLTEAVPKGLDQAERAKRFEELRHQRELASIALGEFQSKVLRDHGAPAVQVAGLDEIQAALPADTALIAWVDIPPVGPNAADPDGEHWGVVIRSRGVPAWVSIAGTGPDGLWSKDDTELASQVRTELRTPSHGDPAKLRSLIDRLQTRRIEPLSRALDDTTDGLPPARRLIVLPSRALAGIPVEVLLANDDTRTVSYAPSATVFKYLREQPRADRHAGLLALGDPVYQRPDSSSDPKPPDHGLLVNAVEPGSNAASRGLKPGDVLLSYNGTALQQRDDLKAVPEPGRSVPVDRWRDGKVDRIELAAGKLGVVFDLQPAPRAIADERQFRQMLAVARSGSEGFAPLPGTRFEVEALAQLFRSDNRNTHILLGTVASEPELDQLATSGTLTNFGVIHLATHAVIDEGVPARSAAILTQVGLPDPLQQALDHKPVFDGRLTVREIQRGWDLKAELVTLSACESALGRDSGGEGFVGFTQALLISGARSVCVSLWKVDDRATSLLMTRFYQNWLGQRPGLEKPLSKVEALHEAKAWLRGLTDTQVNQEWSRITRGEMRKSSKPAPTSHPYTHPHYWAGFILVGDPN